MLTHLQKWGNSQGIRLSKDLLEAAQLKVGDEVSITVQKGQIVVVPTTKVRGKYHLKQLVAQLPKDHHSPELDWGSPSGKEVW